MINLGVLKRESYEDKQTLGKFALFDEMGEILFECKTLELPWKYNQKQVSCIPIGDYKVITRQSKKFKKHFHVIGVEGRSYILIHSGNYYTQIKGCLLFGKSHTDINGDGLRDVTNTRRTLDELLELCPNGFKFMITE